MTPYSDLTVLGKMTPQEAKTVLIDLGELDAEIELAEKVNGQINRKHIFGKSLCLENLLERKWVHTSHTVGFIAPAKDNHKYLPIINSSQITPDFNIKNRKIKITLNGLRVAEYPGGHTHHILFDFYAQNQAPNNETEHLHFNSTYRVREGEHAPVIGHPIFVGLNVGREGVSFRCLTVNVKNEGDEKLLSFLDNDIFKTGLVLLDSIQPAIGQLSKMAIGLTKGIAERRRNVPVQDIYLGLDFSPKPGGAGLCEGTYVAVQIPERNSLVWDWENWAYDTSSGRIVQVSDHTTLIPYNYLAFGVSRLTGL